MNMTDRATQMGDISATKALIHAFSAVGITYSAAGTFLGFAQTVVAIFSGLAGGTWACIQIYKWLKRR